MYQSKKIICKENILWSCLLISGILSLFSAAGILMLLFIIFFIIYYYCKKYISWIDKGIIFLLFYLPFYTLFRLAFIEMGFEKWSGLLNYVRDGVILLLFVNLLLKGFRFIKEDVVWLFFIFNWGFGLILTMINGYFGVGISGVHLSVIPALLYLIIAYGKSSISSEVYEIIFLKVAFIVAIIGILFYSFRPEFYGRLFRIAGNSVDPRVYVRFVSVFFTPNVCGCYLSIAFSMAISRFINKKKLFNLVIAGLFLFCIVLTLSRGSWLFTFVVFVVAFCILKPKWGAILCSFAIPIFLIIGFIMLIRDTGDNPMLNVIQNRLFSIFDKKNISSYGRVSTWQESIMRLFKSPFGYGMGVSTTAQISAGNVAGIEVIDGFYIKTFIETGIIGIIYCVLLVVWSIKRSVVIMKNSSKEIGMSMLFICIGFFVQSLGSNTFDFVCTAPWFWITMGLSTRNKRKRVFYLE